MLRFLLYQMVRWTGPAETASAVWRGNLCLISSHYPSVVINPFSPGTLYSGTLGLDFRIRQKVLALSPQPRNCHRDGMSIINHCNLQGNSSCHARGTAKADLSWPMHQPFWLSCCSSVVWSSSTVFPVLATKRNSCVPWALT